MAETPSRACSRCGCELHRNDQKEYRGDHVSHTLDRCVDLLHRLIARLRGSAETVTCPECAQQTTTGRAACETCGAELSIARLAEELASPRWYTMDSAPRDTRRVLLYVPHYGRTTGLYDNGRWRCPAVLNKGAEPSAWMPLPVPPITDDEPS